MKPRIEAAVGPKHPMDISITTDADADEDQEDEEEEEETTRRIRRIIPLFNPFLAPGAQCGILMFRRSLAPYVSCSGLWVLACSGVQRGCEAPVATLPFCTRFCAEGGGIRLMDLGFQAIWQANRLPILMITQAYGCELSHAGAWNQHFCCCLH